MRRTEKDRAIKRKQKQAAMAVKLSCEHLRRTVTYKLVQGDDSLKAERVRTICKDCGEVILMLSHTVSSGAMDPKAKRNSVNTKHG